MAHIVGTNGNDSLVGTSGVDTIEGLGGNDTLVGLGGADSLNGGLGNDRYVVTSGDVLSDAGGIDTIETSITWHLAAGFENLIATGTATTSHGGNNLDNHITGNAGSNWIAGREGNDTLLGGGGNDTFNMSNGAGASYGADSIDGGTGVDTLDFGAAARTAVLVDLAAGTASGGGTGGAGSVVFVSIENVNGSAFDDQISGNSAANFLFGFDGNDLLEGREGSDRLEGGAGNDWLYGEYGADTLIGGDGNDYLSGDQVGFDGGDASADLLIGGAGNDTLDGGYGGGNTLDGGLGDDTYYVWGPDVLVDAGGIDQVITIHANWTLGDGFENLSTTTDDQGGSAASFLAGNELNNIIDGSKVNEARLEGRGGDDTLYGSAIDGPHSDLDGGDGNDVLVASTGFNTLNGGAGNDRLESGFRPDTFLFTVAPGAANADLIVGFTTDSDDEFNADTIVLDGTVHSGIGVTGNFANGDARFHAAPGASAGHDADDRVIYNTTTGQLWYDADGNGSGVAQLIATLQGAPNLAATDIAVINGGSSGSVINGTSGNDSLVGTPGDDTINGFGGNDTINGGEGADSISGGSGNDSMFAGVDSNLGDGAADTLDGGLGDDIYRNVSTFDGDVVLPDAGGIDTVFAIGDHTLGGGLENLRFDDFFGAFWNGTGNELDNTIVSAFAGGNLFGMGGNDLLVMANAEGFGTAHGGDGNDTLEAGRSSELFGDAGDDTLIAYAIGSTMTGGAGNDSFVFESAGGVHEVEDFASGIDKIRLDATNMTQLGASGNFAAGDARFHIGAAAHDADDRVIYNSTTAELFYDADGNGAGAAELIATLQVGATVVATDIAVDNGTAPPSGSTINGTANNDTLVGGAGNDTINGLAGADLLQGLGGNDSILGGAGWDTLQGGDGGDWLYAGGWSDTMTGGAGADSFVWAEAGNNNRDTVTDFVSGTDELLFENGTLTAMGAAGAWTAGDARFWAAAGATSGHDIDDRLVYNTTTGILYYDPDGSGAGAAQVVATFSGAPGVLATDITVI